MVQLGQVAGVDAEWWQKAVEAFMLVIKGQHEQGLKEITTILDQIKGA